MNSSVDSELSSFAPDHMIETWRGDVAAILSRDLPWQRFSGQRVAITGASGFLGGYLARTLLTLYPAGLITEPLSLVALVRSTERATERLCDIADNAHLSFVEWDLNTISVPPIGNVNYVLHAGSQASPRMYGVDPVGTALPNSVGTAALLTALQRSANPQGFLFISSGEVYGGVAEGQVLSETQFGALDPATIRAAYGESKRLGENLCVGWHQQYGLPTYIVRPFHTYGPGLQSDDGRVFADFAFNVIRGENLSMASDGSAIRTYCYASDAVAGFFSVMLMGRPATPYNVSNREAELSVLDLAQLLTSLYPEPQLLIEHRSRTDPLAYLPSPYQRLVPDVSRLEGLGWCAEIEPAAGFKRMIDAYSRAPKSGLDVVGRVSA